MICPCKAALLCEEAADSWAVVFLELALPFDFWERVVLLVFEINEAESDRPEPDPPHATAPPAPNSVRKQNSY
jgi:hypothetical protein